MHLNLSDVSASLGQSTHNIVLSEMPFFLFIWARRVMDIPNQSKSCQLQTSLNCLEQKRNMHLQLSLKELVNVGKITST